MAWPYLAGIIKVKVSYSFEGRPSLNIHFVLQDSPTSPIIDGALRNCANVFRTQFEDNWEPAAHEDWTITDVTALDWSREGGNEVGTDGTLPLTGDLVTGDAIPANCNVVVSQRTPRTGRSYRGRNYVPGLAASSVDGNTANGATITAWSLIYSDIRTVLATINMKQVVYSMYNQGVERVTPVATVITHTIVNDQVDTQRRRMT